MRSDLTTRISFFTHCHSTESPAHSFKATEQHNDAVHVSAYVFVCEYECVCVKCRAVGSKSRARRIYFHGPYGNSVVCVCKSTDNGRPQRSCVCTLNGVCVCALGGMVLWPRAYGEPLRRRFPSNTHIHPLGLWFVNELLYWLAS